MNGSFGGAGAGAVLVPHLAKTTPYRGEKRIKRPEWPSFVFVAEPPNLT
jgi:hypothetical protein